jgi:hypothetical protein
VEGRRHRRQQPPAARIAQGVLDGLAGERPRRDLELAAGLALEHEQSLARRDEKLGHRWSTS